MNTIIASVVVSTLGLLVFMISLLSPKNSLGIWLFSALLVPYWVGLTLFGVFIPNIAVGMVCACAGLALAPRPKVNLHRADLLWAPIVLALIVMGSQRLVDFSDVLSLLGLLLSGYLLARLAGTVMSEERSTKVLAVTAIALSSASVAELVFGLHPFVGLLSNTTAGAVWSPVQVRGFYTRSELTLGHSIALASTIALLIPFALSRAKTSAGWLFVAALGAAGITATFSRTGLVCGGIAIALSLLSSGKRIRRGLPTVAAVGVVALGFALVSFILPTFAADDQLESSWGQRFKMLELFSLVQPFGAAGNAVITADGRIGYAGASGVYLTVDNWPLVLSLQYGLAISVMLVLLLCILLVLALRSWRSSASIALISVTPAVFSVAMITQFAAVFWVVSGLVVSYTLQAHLHPTGVPTDVVTPGPAPRRRHTQQSAQAPSRHTFTRRTISRWAPGSAVCSHGQQSNFLTPMVRSRRGRT